MLLWARVDDAYEGIGVDSAGDASGASGAVGGEAVMITHPSP
jgi:hypothetical protein